MTNYLLGGMFETNASGDITTSYDAGPTGDLASFNGPPTGASTVTYNYFAGHGSQVATADSGGSTVSTQSYAPWGAPQSTVASNATIHAIVGSHNKQYDTTTTTTSLVLMGARPYDPNTGRFLAVDPVDGGSANNYDYVNQDPINCYDLDGTKAKTPAQRRNAVVRAARSQLGTKYSWGGGGASGPSFGIRDNNGDGTHTLGFDCSGLVEYAYAQAGLSAPGSTYSQDELGNRVRASSVDFGYNDFSALKKGDLLFFANDSHVGIYIGNGTFIHAPHTGDVVKISSLSGYYAINFSQARRIIQG